MESRVRVSHKLSETIGKYFTQYREVKHSSRINWTIKTLHSSNKVIYYVPTLKENISNSKGIIGASLMEVFIRWTPPEERSRLIVNGINGYYLGAAVSHPISGYVAQHYGWEAVFFVTGK